MSNIQITDIVGKNNEWEYKLPPHSENPGKQLYYGNNPIWMLMGRIFSEIYPTEESVQFFEQMAWHGDTISVIRAISFLEIAHDDGIYSRDDFKNNLDALRHHENEYIRQFAITTTERVFKGGI